MGSEKRKAERTELTSRLIIKQLNGVSEAKEVAIEITDVSKAGVGFACTEKLEIGAVYEGFLTIWTKEVIHSFMEIVRIVKRDDTFDYGAIFIGMPEMDSQRIEIYQTINNAQKQ
ncbi:MAG: PilZ domain-containing protein [Lachnospiraceae bacterium]|nr:PilZ domain-containing protein [Candidatus Colinaster equi]